MIYVLLLENVITKKQVYFIGNAPEQYDDLDIIIYFMETNIMTSVNYNVIQTVEWRDDDDENETQEVILQYIDFFGKQDEFGRYNVIWDSKIVCNEIFYLRVKQLQKNGNPFL
jgi:hypothetical protein